MKPFDLYRMFQQNVYSLPFFPWMETTAVGTISMTIQIPFGSKLFINWGDGVIDSFTGTYSQIAISHTYSSSGTKYITASGTGFLDATILQCNSSSLSSINVSENKNLTILYVAHNGLTEIDVTKNIELYTLECSYTNLTILDVTKNINLGSLHCNGIHLTSLDVTKNINLYMLDCIGNNFESLDVSKNSALKFLDGRNNKFTNESVNAILAALVANEQMNGRCLLQGQNPGATATGQGITDKETLIARGWTIETY